MSGPGTSKQQGLCVVRLAEEKEWFRNYDLTVEG